MTSWEKPDLKTIKKYHILEVFTDLNGKYNTGVNKMNMEIIKRNPLIIGIAIILSMYVIGDMVTGVSLLLPSFLLAGIVVGFMINDDIKTGAINGVILGLISGILINVILIAMMYLQGYGNYIVSILLFNVIYLVIEIVIAAFGGVLGCLIQAETLEDVEETDSP